MSATHARTRRTLRVAAYQAPLLPIGSMDAFALLRARVDWCEAAGVQILCCPEALLGGLADYCPPPMQFAIAASQLDHVLAPLASDIVTTIIGFTELADDRLYNSAAVFSRGALVGLYRKHYPAINRSVYAAGSGLPVFHVEGLTFGIAICNDSNYPALARLLADRGATALFVPTNNALSPAKAGTEIVAQSRSVDIGTARENRMWVIRADVAGRCAGLVSYGSSEIVDPTGDVVQSAQRLTEDLIVAEIDDDDREGCGVSANPSLQRTTLNSYAVRRPQKGSY